MSDATKPDPDAKHRTDKARLEYAEEVLEGAVEDAAIEVTIHCGAPMEEFTSEVEGGDWVRVRDCTESIEVYSGTVYGWRRHGKAWEALCRLVSAGWTFSWGADAHSARKKTWKVLWEEDANMVFWHCPTHSDPNWACQVGPVEDGWSLPGEEPEWSEE